MAINKKSPNKVTLPTTTVSSSKTKTKVGLVKPDSISQRKKRKRQEDLMAINKKSTNEVTLPITTASSSKTKTKMKGRLTKRESPSQRRKRICQRHLMSINKKSKNEAEQKLMEGRRKDASIHAKRMLRGKGYKDKVKDKVNQDKVIEDKLNNKYTLDDADKKSAQELLEERTKWTSQYVKNMVNLKEDYTERITNLYKDFKVCIDCSFEEQMTKEESVGISTQIQRCYAANKSSDHPSHLSISNLSGTTYEHLMKVAEFPDEWTSFSCSDKPLLEMHPEKLNLVYLSSDSDYTLEYLDYKKTYVIGGIVDRTRLNGLTMSTAKELGITTAKLPIDQYLHLCDTKISTFNIFDILSKLPKDVTGVSDGATIGR